MPKKRFTSQYSKPQSTVHPSLGSAANAGQHKKDAAPSVNDLINSSRKTAKASGASPAPAPTQTLPPQIRHLLAQPETPALSPRPRVRRRFDAEGRPIPAGPPPPRSWLERSKHAPEWMRKRGEERAHPVDLYQLPGLECNNGRSLQSMCMRQMAKNWEFVREYEQNNLAELQTQLRMELLSHIAIGGPDDGVGFEGLRNILTPPRLLTANEDGDLIDDSRQAFVTTIVKVQKTSQDQGNSTDEDWDAESYSSSLDASDRNDTFFRLDLAGSMGHSVSFRQLMTLLQNPGPSLPAPIPHLTHLSLAYPAATISWRSLLATSKQIPTLTHLSLAYWPTPTLTPNSRAAVMSSQFGKDVQYGATNYYSHSLDNDFREAADVIRRLASRLYALEYLDLTGCSGWTQALRWTGVVSDPAPRSVTPPGILSSSPSPSTHVHVEGIDWRTSWLKLHTLKLHTDITLTEDSHFTAISAFAKGIAEAKASQKILAWWMKKGSRKGVWVDVQSEEFNVYHDFWRGRTDDERKNRALLDSANRIGEVDEEIQILNTILESAEGQHHTIEDMDVVVPAF